jgi:hypothetical protein
MRGKVQNCGRELNRLGKLISLFEALIVFKSKPLSLQIKEVAAFR